VAIVVVVVHFHLVHIVLAILLFVIVSAIDGCSRHRRHDRRVKMRYTALVLVLLRRSHLCRTRWSRHVWRRRRRCLHI
jgi:hypothetical protein